MKKIITGLVLSLICLLPTLMAVLVYIEARQSPIETSTLSSLLWEGPAGSSHQFLMKDKDGKAFIDFVLKLNQNAQEVETIPDNVSTSSPYTATFVNKGVRSVYRYYFSPTHPSNSYYTTPEKKIYRIAATDTIAFLDSDYSSDLYPASILPSFTVAGTALEAQTLNWTYYTYTGKSHSRTVTAETDEIPCFTASYIGISIGSSVIPDESQLVITDDSEKVLFQGSLSDYHPATSLKKLIRTDTLLHFTLRTQWKESDASHYSGDAEFRFDVQTLFDPASHFWLGKTSVELGEMVVLSGQFVEDLSDLSFSSSPDIGFTPTFIQDGDYIRALVPISRDLASGVGEYTLTVTCQGKEYPLTLNVTTPTHSTQVRNYNYSGTINTALRNETNLAEMRKLVSSLPVSSILQCNKPFFLNEGHGIRATFGETIHNNNKTEDDFYSGGLAIVAYVGTPIYGANTGVVAAVTTTTYGGNTVVIDHGWGLYSVYYCVGTVLVEVGQQVTTDTIIAYGGRGSAASHPGYTDGNTSYWELWVGDRPVSYLPLLKSTPVLGNPE